MGLEVDETFDRAERWRRRRKRADLRLGRLPRQPEGSQSRHAGDRRRHEFASTRRMSAATREPPPWKREWPHWMVLLAADRCLMANAPRAIKTAQMLGGD